jgi:hypothetical protein
MRSTARHPRYQRPTDDWLPPQEDPPANTWNALVFDDNEVIRLPSVAPRLHEEPRT